MTATIAEMAKILPTLDKTAFSVLVRAVLGIKDGRDVELHEQLKMGLYEFLMAIGFVTDAQARTILTKLDPIATLYARLFQNADSKNLPTFAVSIADQRYACWPNRDTWLDLEYEEDVETLAEPPVMLITCNVTAMYLRMQGWLNKLRSGKDDPERRHHGGTESIRPEAAPGGRDQGNPDGRGHLWDHDARTGWGTPPGRVPKVAPDDDPGGAGEGERG